MEPWENTLAQVFNSYPRDDRSDPLEQETEWPMLICLLGRFRVLKVGRPFAVHRTVVFADEPVTEQAAAIFNWLFGRTKKPPWLP